MLKLAFIMALVGVACAASTKDATDDLNWDNIPLAGNSSQCIFRMDRGLIGCRNAMTDVIECPGVVVVPAGSPMGVNIVGIARIVDKTVAKDEKIKAESIKYFLYPKSMDNETMFQDHSIKIANKTIDLIMYFGVDNSTAINGLRITDLKCYKRLVSLFTVGEESAHVIKIGKESVNMLGGILITEKEQHKRWLGGFGFGFGFARLAFLNMALGWPFFGLGFGLLG